MVLFSTNNSNAITVKAAFERPVDLASSLISLINLLSKEALKTLRLTPVAGRPVF